MERLVYTKEIENDIDTELVEYSARGELVTENMDFNIDIKCGNDVERMKIYDALIENFYKVRRFYIRYKGFRKLPVSIAFPETFQQKKNYNFKFGVDESRPMLSFQLKVISTRPIIDTTTETPRERKIKEYTKNLSLKDTDKTSEIDPV